MQDDNALIRKYRKNIEVSGLALIIIGAWSVLKTVLTLLLGAKSFQELIGATDSEMEEYRVIYIVTMIMICAVALLFFLYLGTSAVKFSAGRKKKKTFLYIASVFGILTLAGIPLYFTSDDLIQNIDTVLASVLVDLSTCFLIYDMVFSAHRLRKLIQERGED
ncbi:MAG: hypothetical protein K5857_05200 [Lachnospiraceae bacterium]|nr:hypothetical protein [Lachnospiraceae bacterium]